MSFVPGTPGSFADDQSYSPLSDGEDYGLTYLEMESLLQAMHSIDVDEGLRCAEALESRVFMHEQQQNDTQQLGVAPLGTYQMPDSSQSMFAPVNLTNNNNNNNTPSNNRSISSGCSSASGSQAAPCNGSGTNKRLAIRKGPWTKWEDERLRNAVRTFGTYDWDRVCNFVQTRSRKQVRERWFGSLDPEISYEPWTPANDELLRTLNETLGNRWTQIQSYFPGRTSFQVKTRMQTLIRNDKCDAELRWTWDLQEKVDHLVSNGNFPNFRELKKHLPKVLQGVSYQYLLARCNGLANIPF